MRGIPYFLFCSQDQAVIPISKMDTTIQAIKYGNGNDPDLDIILVNAIIPVMMTMMVSVKGILKDSFILFSPFTIHWRNAIFQ